MKLVRLLLLVVACLSALSAYADKRVLGKLGQALKATKIYAKTDINSKVFYSCSAYEYVVVSPTKFKAWTAVLLQNGRYGYVQTEKIATLPYEVTTSEPVSARTASLPSRSGSAVARYSLNFVGVPYKWGGTDLRSGVDCSAFMQKIFGKIGEKLPRTAREQVNVGEQIRRLEDLQPGDRLYFWSSKRNMVGHTGVYLGNGYFCHASYSNGKIVTDYLGKKHWLSILVAARR